MKPQHLRVQAAYALATLHVILLHVDLTEILVLYMCRLCRSTVPLTRRAIKIKHANTWNLRAQIGPNGRARACSRRYIGAAIHHADFRARDVLKRDPPRSGARRSESSSRRIDFDNSTFPVETDPQRFAPSGGQICGRAVHHESPSALCRQFAGGSVTAMSHPPWEIYVELLLPMSDA